MTWAGVLFLGWRSKAARFAVLSLPLILLLFLILPGREIDVEKIREDYVERVKAFKEPSIIGAGRVHVESIVPVCLAELCGMHSGPMEFAT